MCHVRGFSMGGTQNLVNGGTRNEPLEFRTYRVTILPMPISRRGIFALLILLGAAIAYSETVSNAKPTKHPSGSPRASISGFFAKLNSDGEDDRIKPYLANFVSVAPNSPSKAYLATNPVKATDGKTEKVCYLVMEQENPTTQAKPICALLMAASIGESQTQGYFFKMDLDGNLLSAFRTTGKRAEGKAVRGTGEKVDLNIGDPKVQSDFKRELDFWLSGNFRKYWKPKAGQRTPQDQRRLPK